MEADNQTIDIVRRVYGPDDSAALKLAVERKDANTVHLLLKNGCGGGVLPGWLLARAATNDDLPTLAALLPYYADDIHGLESALTIAFREGSTRPARLIIARALTEAIAKELSDV